MAEIIGAAVCVLISSAAVFISIRSFKGKGFLFNNAYIWASKQEREEMDKNPYYRQSAIAFLLIALIFLCIAVEFILKSNWLLSITIILSVTVIVYAIVSSIKIEKRINR